MVFFDHEHVSNGGLLVWAFLSHCTAKFKTGKFDYSFRHSFFFFCSCIRRKSARLVGVGLVRERGCVLSRQSSAQVNTFCQFHNRRQTNCLYKLSYLKVSIAAIWMVGRAGEPCRHGPHRKFHKKEEVPQVVRGHQTETDPPCRISSFLNPENGKFFSIHFVQGGKS